MNQLEQLQRLAPRGTRLYSILTGRSRTGMARRFRVLVAIRGDNGAAPAISDVTWLVAKVAQWPFRDESLQIRGTGFSGPQFIAENVATVLYGDVTALDWRAL